MREIISLRDARKRKLLRYFTGKPCPHGHTSERCVSSRGCIECHCERRRRNPASPEKMREHLKNYRERHPDKIRETQRKYAAANREKIATWSRNRRARVSDADGLHSACDVNALRRAQKDKCALCKQKLAGGGCVDHIVPLRLGGSNWPANLQMLCQTCNVRKSWKRPEDFSREMGMLL